MTAPRIRRFRDSDRDALYDICLKTGADGEDAGASHADPRLLGEVYVGPYVEFEPELAFVVEDLDGVCGYVVGTRDTLSFETTCERAWWPPLRRRYPAGAFAPGSADADVVELIHRPHRTPEDLARTHPSHLHVDLLARAQGRGHGRALLERFITTLREAGSPAVHLGVGMANARAIGFYERLGFEVLRRDRASLTMGRPTR